MDSAIKSGHSPKQETAYNSVQGSSPETGGVAVSGTEALDFRDSVWERLMNPNRIRSFQFGVGESFPILNKIMIGMSQNIDVESLGDMKIYRIDTLDHVILNALKGKLRLSSPSSWEDPWEDSLWRTVINMDYDRYNSKYECFAQCWTTNPSCEAIWRRFKVKGRAIRIETTIKSLLSSIKIPNGEDNGDLDNQVFLSKVHYLGEKDKEDLRHEILEYLRGKWDCPKFDLVRIASLFSKRLPFEYESEVRLVFRQNRDSNTSQGFFEFDSDPHIMITSLQLDPWCGAQEYTTIARLLRAFGFKCSLSDLCEPLVSL